MFRCIKLDFDLTTLMSKIHATFSFVLVFMDVLVSFGAGKKIIVSQNVMILEEISST